MNETRKKSRPVERRSYSVNDHVFERMHRFSLDSRRECAGIYPCSVGQLHSLSKGLYHHRNTATQQNIQRIGPHTRTGFIYLNYPIL
jgi:hypothetical protein